LRAGGAFSRSVPTSDVPCRALGTLASAPWFPIESCHSAKLDRSRRAFTACARAWFRDPCLEDLGPFTRNACHRIAPPNEPFGSFRMNSRARLRPRIRVSRTPFTILAIQSSLRVNDDWVREWLDRLRPTAFCNAFESTIRDTCDRRLPQTLSTTCTHVSLGYRARRTSRFLAGSRVRCMARFHDAPHASATRPASPRRRYLPRVRRFLIPRTISKFAFFVRP